MSFDRGCLQEELKVCGWCEHWTQEWDSSFGKCKIQPTRGDISASGIIVKVTDYGYCDEFRPSEDCISESRLMFEEELKHKEQGGEAAHNGVVPGRDFPATLTKQG